MAVEGFPDISELAVVLTVAHLDSITAAAARHGVARDTVAACVRSVEFTLGITIFPRSATGVRLSPEGTAVIEWLADLVDDARRLRGGVAALRGQWPGPPVLPVGGPALPVGGPVLPVAATATFAEYLLPHWTAAMRAVHPAMRVGCTPGSAADVIDRVRDGSATLGFVEDSAVPSDLSRHTICVDELVVVVGPDHRWTTSAGIDRSLLARTPMVHRREGHGTRPAFEAMIGPLVPPVVECDSLPAVRAAVRRHGAPTVMSSLTVGRDLEDAHLVRIPVEGPPLLRRLSAVWDTMRAVDGPAVDLINLAVETHRSTAPPAVDDHRS